MNTKTRYLVLNAQNVAQRPCDHGLHLPDVQSGKSPSILNPDTAKAFAGMLAQKFLGQRFYVVATLGGAEAFNVISANPKEGVKLVWEDAKTDGTDTGE